MHQIVDRSARAYVRLLGGIADRENGKVESLLPNRGGEWKDPRPVRAVLITEFYLQ